MARHNKVRRLRQGPFKDVIAFHKKYKLGYSGPPRLLDYKIADSRYRHLFEELQELAQANGKRDKVSRRNTLIKITFKPLDGAHYVFV